MVAFNFRDMLPKDRLDALAMCFTFVMIPLTYLYGVFYVVPTLWPVSGVSIELADENTFPYYFNMALSTYFFFQTYSSLTLTMVTDTSCRRIALPIVAQPGWYFCPFCQFYAPPRAHHCPTCNRCILRRDHHCFFAGKCVGYYNQRYFISFLFFLFVTSLYGVVLSFWALIRLVGGFSLTLIPALIFPVFVWVFRVIPVNPIIMIETSIMGFVVIGGGALLGIQFYQMYKGQTFYELQKSDLLYSNSSMRNVVDIFGKNWLIAFLFPLFPSTRVGDGSHYPPRDQTGHVGVTDGQVNSTSKQNAGRKLVKST